MNLGTATVIRGDARRLPLPDRSVDLIVTSPPYFALRSYQDNGEHYPGQIGSETTPVEFLDALIECTREWMRVLKPTGSLFVNLGDKYNSAAGPRSGTATRANIGGGTKWYESQRGAGYASVPIKSLLGLPWRYAIGCIDQLGLILRAEVIWSKPNGLPESVTDRVRRSHEQWFHFTLLPRYFSAVDEIREQAEQGRPQASRAAVLATKHGIGDAHRQALLSRGLGDQGRSAATQSGTGKNTAEVLRLAAEADAALGSYTREFTMTSQTFGKLPGSVWTIPTEPLTVPDHLGVDHFAAFPTEWPRRIITGWSPTGICTACGDGRRPVARYDYVKRDNGRPVRVGTYTDNNFGGKSPLMRDGTGYSTATITGYACACPAPDAPTRPSVILDPFGGTGTVALVAKALGRHGITVDLSMDYSRLARWRTNDPGQLAKACQVDKPPEQTQDQLDLFGVAG